VHLEIRKEKGSEKYYLAHSYREGNAIGKVRVYIGANLSSKELAIKRKSAEIRLKQRIHEAKAINDPFMTALSPSEIEELASIEARGELQVQHLSESDWDKFKEAFTYNTNAIEGSMIKANEVADILRKGQWPNAKSKEDISETYGVSEAIDYIRGRSEHVSLKLIKDLHKIVFKNSKVFAGEFRALGVEVVVADAQGNVLHRGAPSEHIETLLKEMILWYRRNRNKCPPLVLAAVVHNQFENIHPFQDGNGRVGRLLLNNILLKHDLSPINIELKNRSEYYDSLQAYEKEHNIRPTLELMLKEYRALKKLLK